MSLLENLLENVNTVAILGHIRPDGDCVGSCLGVYNYLSDNYPQIEARVYLEAPSEKYGYLRYFESICTDFSEDRQYDLCLCMDCSDTDRLGEAITFFHTAGKRFCVDHHITNKGFGDENVIIPDASSTCEVLYGLLEEGKISRQTAECLYTGIVHDTGVFKYQCTSERTMTIAGRLMSKGIDFGSIIDDSYYRKTYVQNQILGRALLESITFFEGRCIFSVIHKKEMEFYGVGSADLDGIVEQLRVTKGVECAIFLYETDVHEYKVSLRSAGDLDVSRIAAYFGGGGHVKAAGCTMAGSVHDVINNLSGQIARQFQ